MVALVKPGHQEGDPGGNRGGELVFALWRSRKAGPLCFSKRYPTQAPCRVLVPRLRRGRKTVTPRPARTQ